MRLLEQLCAIHGPTGEEQRVRDFILHYINENSHSWKVKPTIISAGIQDNLILVFGKPQCAVISHMDSTGFTLSYNKKLLPIGSPSISEKIKLKTTIDYNKTYSITKGEDYFYLDSKESAPLGTTFTYKNNFNHENNIIQSPYLDNRLGIYILLELAKEMRNGIIAFTAFEEHYSGGVEKVLKIINEEYNVSAVLVNDITSETEGIKLNEGVVISLRDAVIPRRNFIDQIIDFAKKNKIKYQLEVEDQGASDGAVIQRSIYPIDWCFIGIAVENMHSDNERAHENDVSLLILFLIELFK